MADQPSTTWRDYEEVAAHFLNRIASEFGLQRVDGKQTVIGQHTGTTCEIDAKGITADGDGIVLVECRRYTTSRISQEGVGASAYKIRDCGAAGGILVTPLGLQEGAAQIAGAERIHSVQLDPNSTTTVFLMRFLHTVMIGVQPERIAVSATIIGASLEEVSPEPPTD
jgi:hypothetical protein